MEGVPLRAAGSVNSGKAATRAGVQLAWRGADMRIRSAPRGDFMREQPTRHVRAGQAVTLPAACFLSRPRAPVSLIWGLASGLPTPGCVALGK